MSSLNKILLSTLIRNLFNYYKSIGRDIKKNEEKICIYINLTSLFLKRVKENDYNFLAEMIMKDIIFTIQSYLKKYIDDKYILQEIIDKTFFIDEKDISDFLKNNLLPFKRFYFYYQYDEHSSFAIKNLLICRRFKKEFGTNDNKYYFGGILQKKLLEDWGFKYKSVYNKILNIIFAEESNKKKSIPQHLSFKEIISLIKNENSKILSDKEKEEMIKDLKENYRVFDFKKFVFGILENY